MSFPAFSIDNQTSEEVDDKYYAYNKHDNIYNYDHRNKDKNFCPSWPSMTCDSNDF